MTDGWGTWGAPQDPGTSSNLVQITTLSKKEKGKEKKKEKGKKIDRLRRSDPIDEEPSAPIFEEVQPPPLPEEPPIVEPEAMEALDAEIVVDGSAASDTRSIASEPTSLLLFNPRQG